MLAFLAICLTSAAPDPAPAANRTFEELRASLLAAHDRIESLAVRMESSNVDPDGEETGTVRSLAIAKGGRRIYHVHHSRFAGPEDDPEATIQFLGETFDVYYPYDWRLETSKLYVQPPYTLKILAAGPFELLAWWPPSDSSPPPEVGHAPLFLKEVLRKGDCIVRPTQERIDDRWCHVIDIPGTDILWVDADRNVVLRRERRNQDRPDTATIYVYGEFADAGDGILLPYRIERRRPGPDQPITRHRVLGYELNTVDDAQFALNIPPGALIIDRDTDTWRQEPGGFALLERICSRATTIAEASGEGETLGPPAEPRWMAGMALLGASAYCGASSLAARSRRRGEASRPEPSLSGIGTSEAMNPSLGPGD